MPDSKQVKAQINPSISSRIVALADRIKTSRARILADKQLVAGQDDFLFALLASDGITMGALAEKISISASSTTKTAIKLEAAKLIHREASRVDNRQNYAHLTPKGREVAREILADYEKLDEKFFAKIKSKDGERLLKILDRLENPDKKGAGKKPKKAGSKKKGKSSKSK